MRDFERSQAGDQKRDPHPEADDEHYGGMVGLVRLVRLVGLDCEGQRQRSASSQGSLKEIHVATF